MGEFINTVKIFDALIGRELDDGGVIDSIEITITDKKTRKKSSLTISKSPIKQGDRNRD